MATQRYISTSFWDDEWVHDLDKSGKLFYLYLLTNPLTNISGVYKISDSRICFDCDFTKEELKELWNRFAEAGKAVRYKEWVILPSWPAHQKWDERERVARGIISCLQELPEDVFEKLYEIGYKFDLGEVKQTIIKRKQKRGFYNRLSARAIKHGNEQEIESTAHILCEKEHTVRENHNYYNLDSDLDLDLDSDYIYNGVSLKNRSEQTEGKAQRKAKGKTGENYFAINNTNEKYIKEIYDAWRELGDKVIQPHDYMTFLSRDAPLFVLPAVRGIHSNDVLQAIKNLGEVKSLPNTWYFARPSIKTFFSGIERFLPQNYRKEDFVDKKNQLATGKSDKAIQILRELEAKEREQDS